MGIGVRRMQLLSFVLAAVIGAIGGIVIGPITSFQFDTGGMYTMFGFIAAVIGGIGSPLGAVVGGLCLGIATQLAAAYVSSLFAMRWHSPCCWPSCCGGRAVCFPQAPRGARTSARKRASIVPSSVWDCGVAACWPQSAPSWSWASSPGHWGRAA